MEDGSTRLLTATQLGQELGGLKPDQVRRLEREGKVFSIRRSRTSHRRNYPAFQAWPELVGEPMTRVIVALGDLDGHDAYSFFMMATELLGGLAPIEVLCGKVFSPRVLEPFIEQILDRPYPERISAVERAARNHGIPRDGAHSPSAGEIQTSSDRQSDGNSACPARI